MDLLTGNKQFTFLVVKKEVVCIRFVLHAQQKETIIT